VLSADQPSDNEITPSKNNCKAAGLSRQPLPGVYPPTWGLSANPGFIRQPAPGVRVGGGVEMSNPYPYPRKTRALIHGFPLSVVIPIPYFLLFIITGNSVGSISTPLST
jgi:hypothetical protein